MTSPSPNQYSSNTDFFQNVNTQTPLNTNYGYNGRVFLMLKKMPLPMNYTLTVIKNIRKLIIP